MLATIERRFERLQGRWNTFVGESDEREAQQYLDAGADPAKDWQQWPAPLLSLLSQMGKDPADIAESLRAVLARRADRDVIRIIWLDRGELSSMDPPPLVAVQPGYLDLLRPDPEPRVTTMPMTAATRRKFGDEGVELIVSYTDKTPHTAPTPAQGASMPVTPPERPQPPPQTAVRPVETPYSFERAKASTERLARQQARANRRRIHVR